ncbi:MAG: adenylosuccinate lyase [Gemmatimonadetes bacterium]|nr:MAG: adenylosuccinate lyase [Gemmatimonadota bacterium]
MIPRYTLPEMGAIWTDEQKLKNWLEIEILACEAQAELGNIPKEAAQTIREKADFNIERCLEIEKEVKHDVIAFLTNVAEYVGEPARYIHLGMTSSDILDTGLALQLRDAGNLILDQLKTLDGVLKKRALEHKFTPMIGRSHGIHAEPITFGLKLAVWVAENQRNIRRMEQAIETISVGQISGAVGTFAHLDPQVEAYVCQKLGLKPAPISTQIIQRDRHAEFMSTLALIGNSLDKFATEIRHLQRTEVLETEEFFSQGQKGSSAMPHKRNPIICERLSGMARLLRGNALAAMENVPLWHERDISHSSVERVILPDSTITLHYMLHKFINLMEHLIVYPEHMQENMYKYNDLFFSQVVLLELAKAGVSREKAYRWVQRNAMKVWNKESNSLKELLLADDDVRAVLDAEALETAFDIHRHFRHVDTIFKRVGIE